MKIAERLKQMLSQAEDALLAGHNCLVCEREIPDGTPFKLCRGCLSALEKLDDPLCPRCGEPLQTSVSGCRLCDGARFAFESNHSCYYYTKTAKSLIRKLKYSGKKYYVDSISELMRSDASRFKGVDIVTFVPMSKRNTRLRGFNQAELLAEAVSNMLGKEVVCLLTKDEKARHQAGLSRAERLTNPAGTIHLKSDAKMLSGKNILIIDDIFTTGTTLSVCAEELKKLKPKSIRTFTFAKTKYNSPN